MFSKMERSISLGKCGINLCKPQSRLLRYFSPHNSLFCRHAVSLKSLKPLPQASPMEGWNTVPGKKIKKFFPTWGQNAQPGKIEPIFVWQNLLLSGVLSQKA